MVRESVAVESAADRRGHIQARRNDAERIVRARLEHVDDVYVDRSSWRRVDAELQPFVAIIARHDEARSDARRALESIAGLTAEEWRRAWMPLDLGDFMIRVYPDTSD
jgi:hypothetical protein